MADIHDDLDAYVLDDVELEAAERASGLDEVDAVEPPPDAEKANAMLRSMRGIDRELRRIEMLANQEIARVTAWRDDRSHGLTLRRAAIEKALDGYMRALNRLNPKRKTEQFPNGTLRLRGGRRSVIVTDPAGYLAWWRDDTRMAVAKYLGDASRAVDAPVEQIAAEVVELVLSRSPLVTVKVDPSKTGIAEACEQGPAVEGGDDDVALHAVVVDGEQIPGVAYRVPSVDTFGVSL